MSASNHVEEIVLKLMFGRVSATFPPVYYFGVSSTPIEDDGTGITEPAVGNYSRVAYPNIPTLFSFPGGAATNGTVIQFPTATASWGQANYWFCSDGLTGGTMHFRGSINPAQTINSGERPYYEIGSLTISMD
jgi:hypothetical protein